MAENCEGCRYWRQSGVTDNGFVGECRRKAPSPDVSAAAADTVMRFAVWPTTAGGQWCGDFAARPLADELVAEKLAMIEKLEARRRGRRS